MNKIDWTNSIKKTFNKIIKSRAFKYGANSIILIAVVVAIVVVLNVLIDMAQVKWDLTPNKLYSIGDTTKKILKELDKDVTIYGLFDESRISSTSDKEFVELLDQYGKFQHVTISYVDPDKNPGILKEIDPDNVLKDISKSAFVVKSGNKVKNLSYYDLFSTYFDQQTFQTHVTGSLAEQGFTGAIKYVTSEVTPTIYFTIGHDEKDADKNFSSLKDQLVNNNYDVKPVNLVVEEKVPEDAEILVITMGLSRPYCAKSLASSSITFSTKIDEKLIATLFNLLESYLMPSGYLNSHSLSTLTKINFSPSFSTVISSISKVSRSIIFSNFLSSVEIFFPFMFVTTK
jgi:ABC-type uncharacterized transport system involved in gliding motility auxiliary subunit